MKKLTVGILAHVDAGKTTLSEGLLYAAGEIRTLGRVDHKNAFLDTHALEKEKGITIFSKQALLHFKEQNTRIMLLDTPGHVDFGAETERTLSVLDCAILVISGSEGVQSHTETLWQLLRRYKIPTFVFVNKTDIALSTKDDILAALKGSLGKGFVNFTESDKDVFFDALTLCDDLLTEEFLEAGELKTESITAAIERCSVFPCLFGSALKQKGIDELISVLLTYTREKKYPAQFGARVFKITEDEKLGRLTHMKITGGELKVRDIIEQNGISEKISRIRIYSGVKYKEAESVSAGDVCAVMGLTSVRAGEGLGFEKDVFMPVLEPVLNYKVIPPSGLDPQTVLKHLRILEQEEPQLRSEWNEQHREIRLKLMGAVQLEVLARLVHDRFGYDISFGKGSIAYKETIAGAVLGVGHYEPLRHYAEVHLLLEPAERDSGLTFCRDCSEDILDKSYQKLILTHLYEKQHIGVLTGSPITDMKITVVGGRAHKKHTEGGDFRQATYRAVRQGLMQAESVLLEPCYDFTITVPSENLGRLLSDLQQLGAEFSQPQLSEDTAVVCGTAPVSEMQDYGGDIAAFTGGRGRISFRFGGYRPCHNAAEIIENAAYDPEADLSNPPDSVFCGGGAGFTVKWDEVKNYMHEDSGYSFGDDDQPEPKAQAKAMDYVARAANDEELIKIFERTYGPIRRDLRYSMETRKEPKKTELKYKAKPSPTGPEYLLVDGYNVIFSWDKLKALADDSPEDARNALIEILSNYKGYSGMEIIVVFDAYKVKGNKGETERIGNIDVVYTKEAETADMYIEKVSHKLIKNHRVRVATSDQLEQIIILGGGALRISSRELRAEIEESEKVIRSILHIIAEDKDRTKLGDLLDELK